MAFQPQAPASAAGASFMPGNRRAGFALLYWTDSPQPPSPPTVRPQAPDAYHAGALAFQEWRRLDYPSPMFQSTAASMTRTARTTTTITNSRTSVSASTSGI